MSAELEKLRRELERCLGDIRDAARRGHGATRDVWRAMVEMFGGEPRTASPSSGEHANPAEVRAVLRGLVVRFEHRLSLLERREADDDALWTFRHRRLANVADEELAAYIKLVAPPPTIADVFARAAQPPIAPIALPTKGSHELRRCATCGAPRLAEAMYGDCSYCGQPLFSRSHDV